jgi:hypothetical protein
MVCGTPSFHSIWYTARPRPVHVKHIQGKILSYGSMMTHMQGKILSHGSTLTKLWSQEMRFTCDLSLPSFWTQQFGVTTLWEQDDKNKDRRE